MVLYGQSAGANAVLSYSYAYPDAPIVSGFIASSGGTSAINPPTNDAFGQLAQQVGCANLTAAAELACMQKVDVRLLHNTIQATSAGLLGPGGFRAVADNVTIFANLTERIQKGLVAKGVRFPAAVFSASVAACHEGKGRGEDAFADDFPPFLLAAPNHRLHVQRDGCVSALRFQGHDAARRPGVRWTAFPDLRRADRDGVSALFQDRP